MKNSTWTRSELLLAFNLYCRTPFGRLHHRNGDVISLARQIGRTPSAVAMKLVNFASLDPAQQARSVRGLRNASREDRRLWEEFIDNPERLAFESQRIIQQISAPRVRISEASIPSGSTEAEKSVRVRLVQGFFRDAVLASYDYVCAFCGLPLVEVLCASHIIPWSEDEKRRADPRNGLSLCALHDRAFDRGLLTVDESMRVLLTPDLRREQVNRMFVVGFAEIDGAVMTLPRRFAPDPEALAYHRDNIFRR